MPERKLKLTLEYDGTNFSGFQFQSEPETVRTVQGSLENAICSVTEERVRVRGASRTDAGVHARGQVAAFTTTKDIPPYGLMLGLNQHLPPDLRVLRVEEVPLDWDPKREARGKRYRYSYMNRPVASALDRDRTWQIWPAFSVEKMQEAASLFLGTHDFASFRAVGCVSQHARRNIYGSRVVEDSRGLIEFEVVGNAFVRNMVRIMAGTLKEVGHGRMDSKDLQKALLGKERVLAGPTAPARGLCLEEVIYDERLPPREPDWLT